MANLRRILISLSIVFWLSSCVASRQECEIVDWESLGQADGLVGLPALAGRSHKLAEDCPIYQIEPDLQAYARGHSRGLERYCSGDWRERGISEGKSGKLIRNEDQERHLCGQLGIELNFVDYIEGHQEGAKIYCSQLDWSLLGADAVTRELTANPERDRPPMCTSVDAQANLDAYLSGYSNALAIHCLPSTAFKRASSRKHSRPSPICEDQEYERAYVSGKTWLSLGKELREMKKERDDLQEILLTLNQKDKEAAEGMQKTIKRLQRRIDRIADNRRRLGELYR